MSEYGKFNHHLPTPKLDPLRVGEVMGSDAFSVGDWVLLRTWENKPVKVTSLHQDLIFVDQGMGESFEDTLVKYYPGELGYPLDHRFWSQHQKQCYLRCHVDSGLIRRWQGNPHANGLRDDEWKMLILGVLTSVITLAVAGLWMHYQIFRGLSDGLGDALSP